MTVHLGSLYIAGMIVDIILLIYMFLIYRKFNFMFKNLEFFVYHRALIVVSYSLIHLNSALPYNLIIILGNSLFVIASALLLYAVRNLTLLNQDKVYSISLVVTFIVIYTFFTLIVPSFITRMVIFSFITLIQYGSFVFDYFTQKKAANRVYLSTAIVLIVFLTSHAARLLNSFFMNPSNVNPLDGTVIDALLLITLICANLSLCLSLNITFHKMSAGKAMN